MRSGTGSSIASMLTIAPHTPSPLHWSHMLFSELLFALLLVCLVAGMAIVAFTVVSINRRAEAQAADRLQVDVERRPDRAGSARPAAVSPAAAGGRRREGGGEAGQGGQPVHRPGHDRAVRAGRRAGRGVRGVPVGIRRGPPAPRDD